MTIRHLRIFVTVCQTGSITAAAKKLYLAQPSISIAIKEMETHYNQQLFERFSRKLRITPFGMVVYRHSQRIISLFDELENTAVSDNYFNTLRIGTGTAIGKLSIPRIIKDFKELYPDIKITVTIDRTTLYPQALANNDLDFVIIESLPETPGIQSEPVQSSPIVAVCHKDHPLAQKEIIHAQDFTDIDLLLREKGSSTRIEIDHFFEKHKEQINPIWESIDVMALLNAVNENLGVSFLALSHIKAVNYPNLRILNVEGFSAEHHIHVYYHKDKHLTSAMQTFINYFKTHE